jgi:hypothetical protein
MSRIEELIQQLCPEGVEYITLGECLQEYSYHGRHSYKTSMNGYYNANITLWLRTQVRLPIGLISIMQV